MRPGAAAYRILCYGDSNTYGFDPRDGGRYDAEGRWPDVMAKALEACAAASMLNEEAGSSESEGTERAFDVRANGMNGRSIDLSPDGEQDISGIVYTRFLEKNLPADLLLVMLGSNNIPMGADAGRITGGLERMCREFVTKSEEQGGRTPQVLVMVPPVFQDDSSFLWGDVPRQAAESRKLPAFYTEMAKKNGFGCFDVNEIVTAGKWDGVHMTPENHRTLGQALAERVVALATES